MPISRVRSVTEISMIPMTPTPPTRSPTEESESITMKNTAVKRSKNSSSCVERRMEKSFSSAGSSPRMLLRSPMT